MTVPATPAVRILPSDTDEDYSVIELDFDGSKKIRFKSIKVVCTHSRSVSLDTSGQKLCIVEPTENLYVQRVSLIRLRANFRFLRLDKTKSCGDNGLLVV